MTTKPTHHVTINGTKFDFVWPADAHQHVQSFIVHHGLLYACSALTLDICLISDKVYVPEKETLVYLGECDVTENIVFRSSATDLSKY